MKIDHKPNDFIKLLQQSGQLTYWEAEQLFIHYQFASVLDELVREFDARGLSRAREVLPLGSGTRLIRDMLRITCHVAGAENHHTCPVWRGNVESPWEASCGTCKRPAASRALTCAMLFPSSDLKPNPKRRIPEVPGLVSEAQLKKWTSGSRPFPANRALQAMRALHRQGVLSDFYERPDLLVIEAYVGFTKNLRGIRKLLARAWPKMIEENRTFVANWNGFDHWYVSHKSEMTCEGDLIVDLEAYPQAAGHDIYDALSGQPRFAPVKLASVPALIEIRVTPFPLPIDPVEFHTYPQGMLALRLFIRHAAAA